MSQRSVIAFLMSAALTIIVLLGLYLGIAYSQDPLHLFHKPLQKQYRLAWNMRIQAAGIINTFDFDSIILGTSMLENTSSADCDKALGGKFVNISLSGGNFYERSFVLEHALRTRKLAKVIYSLESWYYMGIDTTTSYPADNWQFLYDDCRFNDLQAYLNREYVKILLYNKESGKMTTADRPNAWMDIQEHTCRFGGLDNWVANQDKQGVGPFLRKEVPTVAKLAQPDCEIVRNEEYIRRAKEYVETYVLSYAARTPDTEYLLVFPPYWRFDFARWRQTNSQLFALHQEVIRYVVHRAEELGNVKVFGFEDCSFVDDIANYKDVSHYSPDINEYITGSLASGRHQLSVANVEAYLVRTEKLAREFDLNELADIVKDKIDKFDGK